MRRVAIAGAVAAVLVVSGVALGAAGDVRIHRLHLPPPPAGDDLGHEPPGSTTPDPGDPGTTPPATPAPPPGTQPPPPPAPPPPSGVGCSTGSAATPDATGTLADYTLTLSATTFSSTAPQLTFRGMNVGLDFHTIAIKAAGAAGATLCQTPTITNGSSATFTVTALPAGSYTIYCTIHPLTMHEDITVN